MLGGRLGWVLFYGLDKVRAHPLDAFKLWEGGMASHGGILGLVIFTWVYARWQKVSWPGIGDNLVVVAPIGLFFGRVANFINGELWGREITAAHPPAWAMQFPKELDAAQPELVARAYAHDPAALQVLAGMLPLRHPSQIYEAGLEGVVLFTVLYFVRTRMRAPVGMLTGLFMILYATLRIIGEQFREPDVGIAFTWGLTRGQFLSLFMYVIGAGFVALCADDAPLSASRGSGDAVRAGGLRAVRRGGFFSREKAQKRKKVGMPVIDEPFAAVLLAGGRSRRMGRDKALLPLADGRLLWQRQWDVLRELGPAELFVSGPRGRNFRRRWRVWRTKHRGAGRWAGSRRRWARWSRGGWWCWRWICRG